MAELDSVCNNLHHLDHFAKLGSDAFSDGLKLDTGLIVLGKPLWRYDDDRQMAFRMGYREAEGIAAERAAAKESPRS